MNILITGGAGFIGTNLAHYYLEQDHQVTIFDNLSRPKVESNLDWLKTTKNAKSLKIVVGDIRDTAAVNQVIKGNDVVFHEAGQTAVTTSLIDPRHDFEVNAVGSLNLLEAVRNYSPQTIVFFASTNKVYGNLAGLKLKETDTRYMATGFQAIDETQPLDFHSPYGCSKGSSDQYVRDYSRSYGLKTVVFRQSCIYGVHQFGVEDQGWVAHFVSQVVKDLPITIFGDGKQVRDLLYISDLVSAYDSALKHISVTAGQIYNIGGGIGNTASLIEIIQTLTKIKGKKISIHSQPERVGDQKYFVSDTAKANKDFGFEQKVDLNQGIRLLYDWLKEFNR